MDRRLLGYYERELQHLRHMAGEFAREFPKIAGRLALDEFECADPYVERLLEGFAFLAARVHLKLDAEFPRFTQSLLGSVYPHLLAPTPSMAIVRLQPDAAEGSLAGGFRIPRGTALRSLLGKGEQTACEYRTTQEAKLWPLRIVQAQYHSTGLGALEVPPRLGAQAAVRLRLECTGQTTAGQIQLDDLAVYLRGAVGGPFRLYEQILSRCVGVMVQPVTRPLTWQEVLPGQTVARMGFEDDQALLPYDARSFQGYRLLREYFAFPERFLFVNLCGLGQSFRRGGKATQLDVLILLGEADHDLENMVSTENFELFCVPAINLFEKRADPIDLTDRFSEFHVVPDRTRPLDLEVYQIQRVAGFGVRPQDEQEFRPFYSATDFDVEQGAYYVINRVSRTLSEREKRGVRRSSYAGSEVFITLVDAKAAPYHCDLKQLSVMTLCTNRDLPLHMSVGHGQTDFTWDIGAPLASACCITGPTPPRASFGEGDAAWRMISHLALNYLSLTDSEHGAAALRDLLRVYSEAFDPRIRKEVDGVKSVGSVPIVRRATTAGPIAFARGLELTISLDDDAFEGGGPFLLGAVLERFFAKYVSLNSFTQTVVRTTKRGEVMRWPMSMGRRQIL